MSFISSLGTATGVPIGGAIANTVLFSDASSNLGSVAGFNFLQTMTQSSGTHSVFEVARTINQSGTAGYDGLRVNPSQSTGGSGERNILNCLSNGSKVFRVSYDGQVVISQPWTFNIYNTVSETTNTEYLSSYWSSNVAYLITERTGSGTQRDLIVGTQGLATVRIRAATSANGNVSLLCGTNSTASGAGASVITTLSASSGIQDGLLVNPTINQSGTAGYNGLRVNVTESTIGSSFKQLITVQNAGTARWHILPTGAHVFAVGTECGRFTPSTTTPKMLMEAWTLTTNDIGYQFGGVLSGEMSPSSGRTTFMTVRPGINSSGTGGWTVLQVRANEIGAGSGVKRTIEVLQGTSTFVLGVLPNGRFEIATANTSTTVGAAGGASALPATPLGYISAVTEAGTAIKIPYYNA